MSNQIQLQAFNFKSSAVRVITDPNQEFWFCGTDVCSILGYLNAPKAIQDHCKHKGITKRYTLTEKGNQELVYINEPNLYRLIIKSRKPEAEPFEAWVFEEVLPQIRKTGGYIAPSSPLTKDYEELLKLVMKLQVYADGYAKFQKSITSEAKNPNRQNSVIASTFATMENPEDSYLFVFKPNVHRDLQLANEIIMKHVKQM